MTEGASCRTCGTELRRSAKFCDQCGTPTASATTPAEYKQVTVLFADVVHSMDIAAAVGAERLREVMAGLVGRAAAVVNRYGGTVDKFTGDGIMALFGAPVALEDHALRACLAALDIREEAKRSATDVERRDGIALQLRVGLNSGQVIAGEIGSGPFGYTAIGEHVGMAQRMESVAPPGGVMLSESTARLVENAAVLGDLEMVHIKGADRPVAARRLLGIGTPGAGVTRRQSSLVGRRWEMAAVEGILERSIAGRGGVVALVGPAGIGKSRLVREVSAMAGRRGAEVFTAICESHAREIPFHVVTRLLLAGTGVADLDSEAARARVRAQVSDADLQDVLLFDDLLGIADPDVALPEIDPDARRRRLTALVNTASLARTTPAVFVIEDAHWIDEVSESMLADFLAVIPRTPSLAVITYRPEYQGALARVSGAQTIALAPLSDSETSALTSELLGPNPSVEAVATTIAERASGNPFFAEEIVRELAQRGVLAGDRGKYVCHANVAEIAVPATLQATIAARIDRLSIQAKRTLCAAAVIGSRFGADLMADLGIDPTLDELVTAELIDQVRFTPDTEYAFRHPLIRTVANESQLKSDRAGLHRRLAQAIEGRDPESADENAALIAEHLEAAGDLRAAYDWHMRAGAWSTHRDIGAARVNWERARKIADALPSSDPDRTAMRIAPRTMLCGSGWRGVKPSVSLRFDELRELCAAAGDKASLAIGMAGPAGQQMSHGHVREASKLFSEQMALVESIGDPTLTIGLSVWGMGVKIETGELSDVLRWSQRVIDLADGERVKGNIFVGSPLAWALVMRGVARWWLGRPGWRDDSANAVHLSRSGDPATHATVVAWRHGFAIASGVLVADDAALRDIEEALQIAEGSSDDLALSLAMYTLAVALLHRDAPADRERGLEVFRRVRAMCLHGRFYLSEVPVCDLWCARELGRRGDCDTAIPLVRKAVDDLFGNGQMGYCVLATGVLVETLLNRGRDDDLEEAASAIDRLAASPAGDVRIGEIWLLRLRALLARARGDDAYRDLVDRYREMATSLGFDGHIAWAEAMT